MGSIIKIALPSKGRLQKPTEEFLKQAKLQINRSNERQYEATTSHKQLNAIFQRASDIPQKVKDGHVDLGITGYDLVAESGAFKDEKSSTLSVMNLGFGKSRLAIGIPDSWLDVVSIRDLASISVDWLKNHPSPLRVATEYPKLVREFFTTHGIKVQIIHSEGALEVAPILRSADIIVDTISTGTTFRENRIMEIKGGTVLESETCLICHKKSLNDESKRETVREVVDLMESSLNAKDYLLVMANVQGRDEDEVYNVLSKSGVTGLKGPTISRIMGETNLFAINVAINSDDLIKTISNIRMVDGSGILVMNLIHNFEDESKVYSKLLEKAGISQEE